MSPLPVEAAHLLAVRAEEHRWLIDRLWAEEAVGIVGGEPKCCKSFLALDMAVAVASGRACLRRYAVARPGRVLLFAAEDALHVVRQRLDGICRAAGVALADVDIQVITAPTVRLDVEADRKSLAETVAALRPRLLILDSFVRLHRIDENISCAPRSCSQGHDGWPPPSRWPPADCLTRRPRPRSSSSYSRLGVTTSPRA